MKVYIVTAQNIKGQKYLCDLGNKLGCLATKSREKAEEIAVKHDGEVYSLLMDDSLRLVSRKASWAIYEEAQRIGAI